MDGSVLGPPVLAGKAKPSSSDEKAPDSSDNTTSVRGVGWPKGKKRKKVFISVVSRYIVAFVVVKCLPTYEGQRVERMLT